jgi:hypothetical protein
VFGQRDPEEYARFQERRVEGLRSMTQVRAEDYVDRLIEEMRPKAGISLVPKNPYKVILGLVEP